MHIRRAKIILKNDYIRNYCEFMKLFELWRKTSFSHQDKADEGPIRAAKNNKNKQSFIK
jgi:hypothetical protein